MSVVGDAPIVVPEGNIDSPADKLDSTPGLASTPDLPEDYVDRWRRKYPNVPLS